MDVSGVAKLLAESRSRCTPLEERVVAVLADDVAGVFWTRVVRIVVDLRPGHDRQPFVEQLDERPDQRVFA